jgi:hypothetical protein
VAGPKTLTTRELNRALLARQGLLTRKRVSVETMIGACAGLQTQEPRDAFVSLWSRISGFKREKLFGAADARRVVRGSNLRCTIHTVTAADFIAFRMTLSNVVERDMANWRERYDGLDITKVTAAVRDLLSDGEPRTAKQIGEELQPLFPRVHREGLSHCARIHVPVVMTPTDHRLGYSRPPSLMLAESWLGATLSPATPEAKTELLRRGIAAIGPASAADLRTWSGMTGVREALEPLLPELAEFRDEAGRTLYDLPEAPRPRAGTEAPVRLLGEFDNVALSHADRARIVAPEDARLFNVSKNGRRAFAILIDGQVRGSWQLTRNRDQARIRLMPFHKESASTLDAVAAEGEALLRFLEPDAPRHEVDLVKSGLPTRLTSK